MIITGLRKFGLPLIQDVARLSLEEYEIYMEAAELKEFDQMQLIHQQAWANQVVQATKSNGKKPKYTKFQEFYDDKKQRRKIKIHHAHGRIIDSKEAQQLDQRRKAKIVNDRLQEYYRRKESANE